MIRRKKRIIERLAEQLTSAHAQQHFQQKNVSPAQPRALFDDDRELCNIAVTETSQLQKR